MKPIKLLILSLLAFSMLFTSCKKNPIIITNDVINIESTKATLGGEITSEGGSAVIERGFVYSTTNATPTTEETGTEKFITDLGTGIGEYTKVIDSLTPLTKYYVRSYAINLLGISYGSVKTFRTLDIIYYQTGDYIGQSVRIYGLWWAPVNVGYTEANPYGLLFNWGKNLGFEYLTTGQSAADGNWSEQDQGPCPEGWRVPTSEDYNNLLKASPKGINSGDEPGQWQDAREENPDSLAGRWFGPDCKTATKTTPDKAVFFPAAGCCYGGFLNRGHNAHYWSATSWDSTSSRYLLFDSGGAGIYSNNVSFGFSVRCVRN